jgi:hypothetical protein
MFMTVGVVGHLTENRRYILRDFLFRLISRIPLVRSAEVARHD